MSGTKKFIALLLCLVLVAGLIPGTESHAEGVSFVAINDTLPPELVGTVYSYSGIYYVPYYAFTGYGIYYSYFTQSSTAYLYSQDKQLFFNISTGKTFDGDDYYYSTPAIMRNGVVYLPVSFMCSFFGFTYSYITGSEYGSVLRIKTGSQSLTDTEFISAAGNAMRSYYNSYMSSLTPEVTPSPGVAVTPPQSQQPPDRTGVDVSLSFVGLPDSSLLDILAADAVKACFFLTAEDVRTDPDTVRRIAGEGHSLGVYCTGDMVAEYQETAALIFEAARVRTLMVTALGDYADECAELAATQSLVFHACGLNAVSNGETVPSAYLLSLALEDAADGTDLFMDSTSAGSYLASVLDYLTRNKYDILLLREVG